MFKINAKKRMLKSDNYKKHLAEFKRMQDKALRTE